MTDTADQLLDIDLDRLAAHPRNVRRSLGDIKDLTRSIRDRGIETPLVALPADGAGVHHIVAGHRRRAAAEAAGLVTVPCVVRDYPDEADVLLAMLAENTQRTDGLNIVDEAQALAAVIDLRGGSVSPRKLAAAVGHSETWVRSRLSLLTLPDNALDALHDGSITLDVANALTAVVEWPELVDELVAQRNLTVWQIESAHRAHVARLAVQSAVDALNGVGIATVDEAAWRENQRTWKTLDDLGIEPDTHRGESCHAVIVKSRYDGTTVEIPVCTEPKRHRGRNPDSDIVVTPTEPTDEQRAATIDRRERRIAADARTAWLTERLTGRRIPAADVLELAVATWLDTCSHAVLERTVGLLGIERGDSYLQPRLIHDHIAADPKRLTAVAVALVAAHAEEHARQSLTNPVVTRYLDALDQLGYQPTDWEHAQRLARAA